YVFYAASITIDFMKIFGQLLITLVGGIVALFLQKMFERPHSLEESSINPQGRRIVYNNEEATDSLNNVFSVGFGDVIQDLTWQLAQEMGLDLSQGVVI